VNRREDLERTRRKKIETIRSPREKEKENEQT